VGAGDGEDALCRQRGRHAGHDGSVFELLQTGPERVRFARRHGKLLGKRVNSTAATFSGANPPLREYMRTAGRRATRFLAISELFLRRPPRTIGSGRPEVFNDGRRVVL